MQKTKIDGLKGTIRGLETAIEVLLIAVAYYIVWHYCYEPGTFYAFAGKGKYLLTGVYVLLAIVIIYNYDGFQFGYLKLTDVLVSQVISFFIVNVITYFQLCLIANRMIPLLPMLLLLVMDAAIALICSFIYTKLYHRIYVPKNMVMIFGSRNAISLKFKMETRSDKYRIAKLLPVDLGYEKICREIVHFDAVIINDVPAQIRNDILKFCYENELRTYVVPKLSDIIIQGGTSISLFDTPLILVRGKGLNPMQRFWKRAFDLVLSAVVLVVALPAMLIVAVAIKCEDGGPILYKQNRVTRNAKVFKILKFRSMRVDAEKNGSTAPAVKDDPRVTKVGKFIRATRLDELPQLLNILKGDMSFVGPRPERVKNTKELMESIPEFGYRLKVKGGLTGYAQIYGKYNTSFYDKLRLDMMYIQNYSLLLDIKLILMTVRIILNKESTEGFNTEEEQKRICDELRRQNLSVDPEETVATK